MDDVNWQEEIRNNSKKKLLKDAHQLREQMQNDIKSAPLIKEDRNRL
ncbi:MAG: hypothetical protein ACLPHE_02460 [Methanobacterium sp.]|jgi:hypothetical protein